MKFRKKPVVIDALLWNGHNLDEILKFGENNISHAGGGQLTILNEVGPTTAVEGDWVVKGNKGEFYPCKPEIFVTIYDKVE